jgi:uncharacterized protein YjbI with pentapeptide repeats
MASTEAYNALIGSDKQWYDFHSNHIGIIDLKLAELKDADIKGKDLSSCDLSGADLENANLDRCKFHKSVFSNTCLEGVSLVSCNISSCIFDNANLRKAVFRKTSLQNTNFSKTGLKKTEFINCKLHNCTFENADLGSAKIELTDIYCSKFNDIDSDNFYLINSEITKSSFGQSCFNHANFKGLNFKNCAMKNCQISSSELDEVDFINCDIYKLDLNNTSVYSLNFSKSTLTSVDLSQFDLPNTVFLDTAINKSDWPKQKGITTMTGRYIASHSLLGQPVQDLKGLSPTLRREIADAQYLREILKTNIGVTKYILKIWGFTTDYGQSLVRLSAVAILIILLLTSVFVVCDGNIAEWPNNIKNGLKAIGYVSSSFIGFGLNKSLIVARNQEYLLFIARVLGLFILGLWIGIAASKLVKLSAE